MPNQQRQKVHIHFLILVLKLGYVRLSRNLYIPFVRLSTYKKYTLESIPHQFCDHILGLFGRSNLVTWSPAAEMTRSPPVRANSRPRSLQGFVCPLLPPDATALLPNTFETPKGKLSLRFVQLSFSPPTFPLPPTAFVPRKVITETVDV